MPLQNDVIHNQIRSYATIFDGNVEPDVECLGRGRKVIFVLRGFTTKRCFMKGS